MGIQESLAKRRTYYNINKELPVAEADVIALVENTTELVPDAFNMKSARVIVATKEKQDALWDAIYEAFGGKVAREKIDSFKAGYGTLLYFYDEDVVKGLQEQFPLYAPNFPIWAQQANGMLQFAIWTALADLGLGVNLQHYNPLIDDEVKQLFQVPQSWKLIAQMPFGALQAAPAPIQKLPVKERVQVFEG